TGVTEEHVWPRTKKKKQKREARHSAHPLDVSVLGIHVVEPRKGCLRGRKVLGDTESITEDDVAGRSKTPEMNTEVVLEETFEIEMDENQETSDSAKSIQRAGNWLSR
ncbi:MAG: uncharacterized protein A8A55_3277, partial [Amphiamblys sp. WSBS2006]